MNNLFFWIIVCSWLIPMGIRMYNRSRARRLQNGNFPGPDYRQQGYPPQNYPPQNHPGYPMEPPVIRPAEEAPPAAPPSNPSNPGGSYQQSGSYQPEAPTPASLPDGNSGPQGYRAKKLAELDAKFTNGRIAMEDYMKQRQEIMNG
ncbi:hypothetical protein [Paenarthrobacter sp. NPDC057981]|uniref:hypothetical protein n=1 Tax=Paenarthrobacter sp. NPDC057981 TaxID=3346297 RepID=UPI0036DBD18D